jgi:long-chain fatty acid transport protein
MWDINERARVGVNYRSKVRHNLSGDAEWHLVGPVLPMTPSWHPFSIRGAGYAEKEDASVKITTPESLSLHGMYKIDPKWNVYGDVTWTRHSRFNQAAPEIWGNEKVVVPMKPPAAKPAAMKPS